MAENKETKKVPEKTNELTDEELGGVAGGAGLRENSRLDTNKKLSSIPGAAKKDESVGTSTFI